MRESAKQRLVRLNTQAEFPYLIEVTYYNKDGGVEIYRYANSDNNISFEGNVYESSCFSLQPPEKTQTSIGNASITISAVNQEWIRRIRDTQKRAKLRFIATIVYDENGEQFVEAMEDYEFTLTEAKWNDITISWTMEFDNKMNIRIPCDSATSHKIPSLG